MTALRGIGIRGAKRELSRLVNEAKRGIESIITDRGTPVARLVPIEPAALTFEEQVRRLERLGSIDATDGGPELLPPRCRAETTALCNICSRTVTADGERALLLGCLRRTLPDPQ